MIKAIYKEVADLNKVTGKGAFHVDHIDPLKHKLVCGLHTEMNLQILTAHQNIRKGNSFAPYGVDKDDNRYELVLLSINQDFQIIGQTQLQPTLTR